MSITIEDIVLSHKSAVDLAERLTNEIERLQAEAAAMREALEEAKAYLLADVRTWNPLPNIETALAADAGRGLLERLRIVQAQRDYQNEQIRRLEGTLKAVRKPRGKGEPI